MKLVITNFYDDSNSEGYDKRQVEPKPEWEYFESSVPKENQWIYFSHADNMTNEYRSHEYFSGNKNWYSQFNYDRWTDKKSFDEALNFFNTHRLKYKGFEYSRVSAIHNKKLRINLVFSSSHLGIWVDNDNIYEGPILSEETFDLLMKDLGIKIEKV